MLRFNRSTASRTTAIGLSGAVALGGLIATALPAAAHVSANLYGSPPVAGKSVAVFLRVPHGCSHGAATTGLTVQLPDSVATATPQNKPGWTLSVTRDADENVRTISWTGGSLPDGAFEDFGLRFRLPETVGTTVALAAIQTCGQEETPWIGEDAPSVTTIADPALEPVDPVDPVEPPAPVVWTGEVVAKRWATGAGAKRLRIVVDASAVHRGRTVTLRQGNGTVIARLRLDKAGDAVLLAKGRVANKVKVGSVVQAAVGTAPSGVGGTLLATTRVR